MGEQVAEAALQADPLWGIIVTLLMIAVVALTAGIVYLYKSGSKERETLRKEKAEAEKEFRITERQTLTAALGSLQQVADGYKLDERDREKNIAWRERMKSNYDTLKTEQHRLQEKLDALPEDVATIVLAKLNS